jgi:hypothetical protein
VTKELRTEGKLFCTHTSPLRSVAIMFSPDTAPYVRSYFQPSFEAAARSLQVEPIIAPFGASFPYIAKSY